MLINVCIRNIVDCEWNDWINGTCTKACGGGTRTNVRTEKVPAAYGGEQCDGTAWIKESCNIQECPGNEIFMVFYPAANNFNCVCLDIFSTYMIVVRNTTIFSTLQFLV